MNKKGMEQAYWMMGALIMIALILVVYTNFGNKTFGLFGREVNKNTLQIKDSACKLDTQKAKDQGLVVDRSNDRDCDYRLDTCDICVALTCTRDTTKDIDFDGMPDVCDEKENDKTKIACKSGFKLTEDGRCTEGFLT